MKQKFSARLYASSTWVCVSVPFNVLEVFGAKGRIAVKGTLNGFEFRSSLFPNGDGTHFMLVNKTMQNHTGVKAGDRVEIEVEKDAEPRRIAIPEDLSAVLLSRPQVKQAFEKFSYSHQKEWVSWIAEAKKPETRKRRIEKVVQDLLGKTL